MAGCFYCGLWNSAGHPRCDRPGCSYMVHGYGPEGKRTKSYCDSHRSGGVA